ncbi:MAG: LPS assembly lipoprotein LptE [Thermoanaerobaculia bacterium]
MDQTSRRRSRPSRSTGKSFPSVVPDAASADAEISGAVTSFITEPYPLPDSEGRATQYEILIVARVKLTQKVPERELYANEGYQFRASYEVQASELGFQDRETPAIEATAKDFAETLVTDLLEGF